MYDPKAILRKLERERGLPAGVLDALWAQESSRGRNMLNPSNGAAGHFQLMPENYRAAGIDPNDFLASATWAADYAKQAIQKFPGLDPVDAIASHHYGGPNTAQWGPRTRKYVEDIRGRLMPDVRMASNDMTQPVPTGDPVTGRMDMPQGSLPPEMGGGPSVLTGDLL